MSIGRIFYSDFGLFYQVPRNSGAIYSATNVIDTYVYRGLMEQSNIGMSAAAGAVFPEPVSASEEAVSASSLREAVMETGAAERETISSPGPESSCSEIRGVTSVKDSEPIRISCRRAASRPSSAPPSRNARTAAVLTERCQDQRLPEETREATEPAEETEFPEEEAARASARTASRHPCRKLSGISGTSDAI
jgi:hypothetical protein